MLCLWWAGLGCVVSWYHRFVSDKLFSVQDRLRRRLERAGGRDTPSTTKHSTTQHSTPTHSTRKQSTAQHTAARLLSSTVGAMKRERARRMKYIAVEKNKKVKEKTSGRGPPKLAPLVYFASTSEWRRKCIHVLQLASVHNRIKIQTPIMCMYSPP